MFCNKKTNLLHLVGLLFPRIKSRSFNYAYLKRTVGVTENITLTVKYMSFCPGKFR